MLTQASSVEVSWESCRCGTPRLLFSWSLHFQLMDEQIQVSRLMSPQLTHRRDLLRSRRSVCHRTMSEPHSGLGTTSKAQTMCPSSKHSWPATKGAFLLNWRGVGSRLSKANALFAPRPHAPPQTEVAHTNTGTSVVRWDPTVGNGGGPSARLQRYTFWSLVIYGSGRGAPFEKKGRCTVATRWDAEF